MNDATIPSLWHGLAANWRAEPGDTIAAAEVSALLSRYSNPRDRALAQWRGVPPFRANPAALPPLAAE